MQSEELIRSLAAKARPVKRLRHPAWRTAAWMSISLAYAAGFVWVTGLRPDIAQKLAEPRFLVEVTSALMTSMMAAAGAFCAGCPGRPLWERFGAFPFLAIWLASLGEGCWRQLEQGGTAALQIHVDLVCFESILLVGFLPAVLIIMMVRRAAPIAPMSTMGLAALAATALGAAALRLFHDQDVSLMLLVWQFGTVVMMATLAFLAGRLFLRWHHPDVASRAGAMTC